VCPTKKEIVMNRTLFTSVEMTNREQALHILAETAYTVIKLRHHLDDDDKTLETIMSAVRGGYAFGGMEALGKKNDQ
jgi:hypothetical protein